MPARLRSLLKAGFEALARGDYAAAAEHCRNILGERPDLPRAHFLASRIALAHGDRDAARRALETTVRLNDRFAAAWASLAWLYVTDGNLLRGEACLRNAAVTETGNAATRNQIGTVFRLVGNLKASHEWHEKAVEADPDHLSFRIDLANSHVYAGDLDTARALLEDAVRREPGNARAHWLLSQARRADTTDHLDTMRRLLEDDPTDRDTAWLQYAIGKECEDLGNDAEAFVAWQHGAAARRRTVEYDEQADIELFETLEETFTAEWLAGREPGCYDAAPVFIVGMPRTGSTLLDRMLDAHPAVCSAGELRQFGFAVRSLTGNPEPRQFTAALMRDAATADVAGIGATYIESIRSLRGGDAHVIDKLPSNYLYLPLILAALPNARVIHIRRDPLDTCLAVFKQLFADAYLFSYDLSELARHYARYRRLMDVWSERFPDRFHTVDYEALVAEPEETLRVALQYIGLSWNAACLDYFRESANASTASAVQVREAPHQRTVGRWRRFRRELAPVIELLGDPDAA